MTGVRVLFAALLAVSVPSFCMAKQMLSGTMICETIEMYNGLFVSPVPCSPPVYVSATAINNPDTLSTRRSCTPMSTTDASCMPKIASSWRGKKKKNTPRNAAPASPYPAATCTALSARSA